MNFETVTSLKTKMEKKIYIRKMCPHGTRKNNCKLCGGSSICPHNKLKQYCIPCGGSSICPHNKQKLLCKICTLSFLCPHEKNKYTCLICTPNQLCPHKIRKNRCTICTPALVCLHKIRKQECLICTPNQLCPHEIRKNSCIICTPALVCLHKIRKQKCKICTNPIKVTICTMFSGARTADKRRNRFDPVNFIDKVFLQDLIANCRDNCYYCKIQMQYIVKDRSLATLERLDNKLGHIKTNCVIACWGCNLRHKD